MAQNNNKMLLFVCSSPNFGRVENISNLQYSGRVLNLSRDVSDADISSFNGDFIVVNASNLDEMEKIRLINLDTCFKVAVLRKHESVKSEWVNQIKYDFIVKDNQLDILSKAKTRVEVINHVKFMDMSKKTPDSNMKFHLKKLRNLIPFLSFLFAAKYN